jgi:hypothetical protein
MESSEEGWLPHEVKSHNHKGSILKENLMSGDHGILTRVNKLLGKSVEENPYVFGLTP